MNGDPFKVFWSNLTDNKLLKSKITFVSVSGTLNSVLVMIHFFNAKTSCCNNKCNAFVHVDILSIVRALLLRNHSKRGSMQISATALCLWRKRVIRHSSMRHDCNGCCSKVSEKKCSPKKSQHDFFFLEECHKLLLLDPSDSVLQSGLPNDLVSSKVMWSNHFWLGFIDKWLNLVGAEREHFVKYYNREWIL